MYKNKFLAGLIISMLITFSSYAQQTTAYDFNMNDCNGQMHHLFSELDSGNVVILEFFMLSCSPCIDAGQKLEVMYQNLKSSYGNKIRYYHFGYTNSYNCTQITNWVNNYGFSSVPFDSGAVQVAYYGGMGMPTIAVVAGSAHDVLFSKMGFNTSDTTDIADEIRNFFAPASINNEQLVDFSVAVFPTIVKNEISISIKSSLNTNCEISISNLLGRDVYNVGRLVVVKGESTHSLTIPDFSAGYYLVSIKYEGKIVSKKITISN
jgi:thiol-disulfide isomerase/thioredoxin